MKIPKGMKFSAFPLYSEMVEKARQAGACEDALSTLRKYSSVMQLLLHEPLEQVASFAYWYARDVLKGRWVEAEPVIRQDAEWAYRYARYVLKGRWVEAEPVILQDAEWAYRYARYVLKGRCPEEKEAKI